MTNSHLKRFLMSLPRREMQIKTTKMYHLTLVRMTTIKKSTNNKCLRGCGEKRTLLHCWKEHKLVLPLWRITWRFHKELEIKLSHEAAIPILGIYPERMKTNSKMIHAPQCFQQHYLYQLKHGSNLNVNWQTKG